MIDEVLFKLGWEERYLGFGSTRLPGRLAQGVGGLGLSPWK